jgi:hypothetical protein
MLFLPMLFTAPVVLFVLLGSLGYTGIVSEKNEMNAKIDKNVGLLKFITDFLKYYKVSIMIAYCIVIILNSFTYLGNVSGVFAIIVVLLIYKNIIKIDLFKPVEPDEDLLSPIVENQINRRHH